MTLLDLESGVSQLTINTGMEVLGIGVTEDTVVAISDEKATTWKLPGGSFHPGAITNVVDSVQTIDIGVEERHSLEAALISPDSRYIIVEWGCGSHLHSATTGELLHSFGAPGSGLWFTPDSHNVGFATSRCLLNITTQCDLQIGATVEVDIHQEKYGCPYTSSDYQVTHDGWVLGSNKERLLILPPLWRSDMLWRMWNGQFLALLHGVLPEPVILEFQKPLSLPRSSIS